MQEKDLWEYFWNKRAAESKMFSKDMIWVHRKDFEEVKNCFTKEYNLLHPEKSYRSSAYIKHVHAIDEGDYFCIHQDYGNLSKFFLLGIIHFLFDVIPGFVFCYLKGISARSLTLFPKGKES
jgi:hypothetical protein